MKKFIISTFLFLACVMLTSAQEKYDTYYSSYFDKELNIEVSYEAGSDPDIYVQVIGQHGYEEVYLKFDGKDAKLLSYTLQEIKAKYTEWKNVAKENNVKSLNKEINIDMPRATVAWFSSKWWFNFRHKLNPKFIILESGKYLFVLSDTVTASSNEYIDMEYFLVLSDESDFDKLIKAIDKDSIIKYFQNKQNQADLFK